MTTEKRTPEDGEPSDKQLEHSASEDADQPPKSDRQLELEERLRKQRERVRASQAELRRHKAMMRARVKRTERKAETKDKILLGAYLQHVYGTRLEHMPAGERSRLAGWLTDRDQEHLHGRGFPVPAPEPATDSAPKD